MPRFWTLVARARPLLLALAWTCSTAVAGDPTYFPPPGEWQRMAPAELGMDAEALAAAIEFAKSHETDWPKDFSRQEEMFGALLGPIPSDRASTNGLVIR